ncbi:MAG: uroporphyrinogen-III C-methyltransferase, partial [Cellvibrionaceae bacterium]|nr:uroporphyrinogen-III C-methyltransferase [Cellvibrionaceae bacterium]
GKPKVDKDTSKPKAAKATPTAKTAEADKAPAANKAPAAAKTAAASKKQGGGFGTLLLWLLVLILLAAVGGGAYYGWQYWQQDQADKSELQSLIDSQNQKLQALAQGQQQFSSNLQSSENTKQELDQALQAIQLRLDSHNKRLISMSSTSREDWLLAEAEYLLRLANQRLLTERATKGAQGLLETADAILMEMDDIDLFPIRQAIGKDLAALKLAPKVDRDGLFLRLAGLAGQIDKLPVLPRHTPVVEKNLELETPELPEHVSWQHRASAWLDTFVEYMSHYFVVRRNEPVKPLLTPEAQGYIKLNLRFMLEQAQLAMLREEKIVYETAIQQAREWLQTQFPPNSQIDAFIKELNDLEGTEVVAPLPDISSSLEQLRVYIDRLHKVKSAQPKPPAGQNSVPSDGSANGEV